MRFNRPVSNRPIKFQAADFWKILLLSAALALGACSREGDVDFDKTIKLNQPDSFAVFLNPIAGLASGDYVIEANVDTAGQIDGIPVFWVDEQPASGSIFYQEVLARVDFKDPENSLILTKPSNNHHYGGLRAGFDLSNPSTRINYDVMLNWILEGAPEN